MANSTETRLALMEQALQKALVELKDVITASEKKQDEINKRFLEYVTQHEFKPVRVAYYALMASLFSGLTTAVFVKVFGIS